jgi:hypothetical protein
LESWTISLKVNWKAGSAWWPSKKQSNARGWDSKSCKLCGLCLFQWKSQLEEIFVAVEIGESQPRHAWGKIGQY